MDEHEEIDILMQLFTSRAGKEYMLSGSYRLPYLCSRVDDVLTDGEEMYTFSLKEYMMYYD